MREDGTVYLTEAAQIVGVSRRTLYLWMADGKLPYTKVTFGHRSRRVKLEHVQRLAHRWYNDDVIEESDLTNGR